MLDVMKARRGGDYVKLASVIMKTSFEQTGDIENSLYGLFTKIASADSFGPGEMELASAVYSAMGNLEKKAVSPLSFVTSGAKALSNTLGMAGNLLQSEGMLGMAGGALAGGGLWGLNRALTSEDDKARKLEIQRDTFRRLNAEVEAELARRNLARTPSNTAAVVDYLT